MPPMLRYSRRTSHQPPTTFTSASRLSMRKLRSIRSLSKSLPNTERSKNQRLSNKLNKLNEGGFEAELVFKAPKSLIDFSLDFSNSPVIFAKYCSSSHYKVDVPSLVISSIKNINNRGQVYQPAPQQMAYGMPMFVQAYQQAPYVDMAQIAAMQQYQQMNFGGQQGFYGQPGIGFQGQQGMAFQGQPGFQGQQQFSGQQGFRGGRGRGGFQGGRGGHSGHHNHGGERRGYNNEGYRGGRGRRDDGEHRGSRPQRGEGMFGSVSNLVQNREAFDKLTTEERSKIFKQLLSDSLKTLTNITIL